MTIIAPFNEAWQFNEKEELWLRKMSIGSVLNVCSGHSDIGDIKVDLNEKATIKADMHYLPFKHLSFGTVIWDPPFAIYHNYGECYRTVAQFTHIAKHRFINVGMGYGLCPFFRAFKPRLFWKRYGFKLRFFGVYDRLITNLEAFPSTN